jgi:hypothetical protein
MCLGGAGFHAHADRGHVTGQAGLGDQAGGIVLAPLGHGAGSALDSGDVHFRRFGWLPGHYWRDKRRRPLG